MADKHVSKGTINSGIKGAKVFEPWELNSEGMVVGKLWDGYT